jgi:tetratricopeptide (TPR) repeat protein
MLALFFVHAVAAQLKPQSKNEEASASPVAVKPSDAYKQDLIRRIGVAAAAAGQAEAAHAANLELGKVYLELGLLYEDAAWWDRSEAALTHAVPLLRTGPMPDLATVIGELGSLHIAMGKLRDSEKEEKEALKIRQSFGDPLQIARSQNDLAILYLTKQNYRKAKDFAQAAEAELATDERASVTDRMIAQLILSEALCYLKECVSAIPLLKANLEAAKTKMSSNDFPIGVSKFLLGFGYWKSGDMSRAEEYLRDGIAQMGIQLGWGHPTYVRALRQYALFLHETHQMEAASAVERSIRQSEAVVDVHSIQTAQGMFSLGGLR